MAIYRKLTELEKLKLSHSQLSVSDLECVPMAAFQEVFNNFICGVKYTKYTELFKYIVEYPGFVPDNSVINFDRWFEKHDVFSDYLENPKSAINFVMPSIYSLGGYFMESISFLSFVIYKSYRDDGKKLTKLLLRPDLNLNISESYHVTLYAIPNVKFLYMLFEACSDKTRSFVKLPTLDKKFKFETDIGFLEFPPGTTLINILTKLPKCEYTDRLIESVCKLDLGSPSQKESRCCIL